MHINESSWCAASFGIQNKFIEAENETWLNMKAWWLKAKTNQKKGAVGSISNKQAKGIKREDK